MIKTSLFMFRSFVLLAVAFGGSISFSQNLQDIPKDLKITLERTICYGTCPSYILTISADGTVTFDGRQYTKQKGVVTGKINQDHVKQLIAEFDKAKYFSLKDRYQTQNDGCPEVWTDAPAVTTSFKANGRQKKIVHYLGCEEGNGKGVYPKLLHDLENKIDEIVGTEQWIR
ncbi:MAG TPA: DUF6438 domain-containing protein [Blastocatellia bacterium]|nr:DUF6438 domain-containing protein [Blastocatellia bacterium]